jgi:hypothetical protein
MQHMISGSAVHCKKVYASHYISPIFIEELWIILFLLCGFFGVKDSYCIWYLPFQDKSYTYENYVLLKLHEISHILLHFQVKVIEQHQSPVTWLGFFLL